MTYGANAARPTGASAASHACEWTPESRASRRPTNPSATSVADAMKNDSTLTGIVGSAPRAQNGRTTRSHAKFEYASTGSVPGFRTSPWPRARFFAYANVIPASSAMKLPYCRTE